MQNSQSEAPDAVFARARFNFMRLRWSAVRVSAVLIVLSITMIAVRGLNLGLDFTGGTLIEANFPAAVALDPLRDGLNNDGFPGSKVQNFGTTRDVLIRVPPQPGQDTAQTASTIVTLITQISGAEPELRRVEFVGPQVGEELRDQGGLAVLYAIFGIIIYIWLRFEKKFSLGAVLALVHDVILVLGLFALLQLDFDLTVLAAILAVIGYSLNDTIVVFDRIRETFRHLRVGTPEQVMNLAVNDTLSRTLMTSFTTLLVLLALALIGGEAVFGFAVALIAGIVVGTYSSIYVAAGLTLWLNVTRKDLITERKVEEVEEELP